MNDSDAQKKLLGLWLEKADDALLSAELELNAGHANFAMNRLYYACFYHRLVIPAKAGIHFLSF